MTQEYPRLNAVVVGDYRYPTNTQNKQYGVRIQGSIAKQKVYASSDTPIRFNDPCWTPKQDCAWFLANIANGADVETCELGDPDPIGAVTKLRCYGVLNYQIAPGVAVRGGLDFDTAVEDDEEITTSTTYLFPTVLQDFEATTYIF